MLTTIKQVKSLTITDVQGLDPIRVYIENYDAGKGRITINCYTSAWTAYWGAMSGDTIEKFFTRCNPEYLAGNLGCSDVIKPSKRNEAYLIKVIKAVQQALLEETKEVA